MNKKAVVFVDVQNDFIVGALRNPDAIKAVPPMIDFARKAVENGDRLYATRDTHEKETYLASLEGRKLPVEHCIEMTEGWMIDDRLMSVIADGVTIVNKPTFGSFDLADVIAEDYEGECPEEIVLCGFCTDICVVSNALILRAKFPNTRISVVESLCAGTAKANHDAAIAVMKSCQIEVV
ncbi:MAG: cysteine hydrolase [Bacteroidales bacterium]|nr:cysteine hydrolase [Bacteroidales bacterium]